MTPTTAVPAKVSGNTISLTNWSTHIQANINYMIQQGADIVAAATITTVTARVHKITGNTGISNITAGLAGTQLVLWFTGTPLLTHTAVGGATGTLVLAGGANYQVVANDVLAFECDTAGQWHQLGSAADAAIRTIRGAITMGGGGYTINLGTGFTVASGGAGICNITITTPFSASPICVVSPNNETTAYFQVQSVATNSIQIRVYASAGGALTDNKSFMFIAMLVA